MTILADAVLFALAFASSSSATEICVTNQHIKESRLIYGAKPAMCEVVTDINVTASSYISPSYHGSEQGIITGRGTIADMSVDDMSSPAKNPYAIATLSRTRQICGVILGGRPDFANDRAQMFRAEVTKDDVTWIRATVGGLEDISAGCSVSTKTTTAFFTSAIEGNKLKITATKILYRAAAAFRMAVIVDCSIDTSHLSTCFSCSTSGTWRCNRKNMEPNDVPLCHGFSCTKTVDKISGHVISRDCQQHACSQAVVTSDTYVVYCCTGFGCNSAAYRAPSIFLIGIMLLLVYFQKGHLHVFQ